MKRQSQTRTILPTKNTVRDTPKSGHGFSGFAGFIAVTRFAFVLGSLRRNWGVFHFWEGESGDSVYD